MSILLDSCSVTCDQALLSFRLVNHLYSCGNAKQNILACDPVRVNKSDAKIRLDRKLVIMRKYEWNPVNYGHQEAVCRSDRIIRGSVLSVIILENMYELLIRRNLNGTFRNIRRVSVLNGYKRMSVERGSTVPFLSPLVSSILGFT